MIMFQQKLMAGALFTKVYSVTQENTASAFGSGSVEVLATPAMIAFLEGTALRGVQPFLTEGYTTVGTEVCVKHLKATPVGMKVTCRAVLKTIDGSKLTFDVEARDEEGLIGKGTHRRSIIHLESFMKKILKTD
jgi:fluoroacetyl-CoA thioesterase